MSADTGKTNNDQTTPTGTEPREPQEAEESGDEAASLLSFILSFGITVKDLKDGMDGMGDGPNDTLPLMAGALTVLQAGQLWNNKDIAQITITLTAAGKVALTQILAGGPVEPFPVGGTMPTHNDPPPASGTFSINRFTL